MVRTPTHRRPTHPGEMLNEEFLKPMGITQSQLADAIGVPYQRINEIVNRRRGITPKRGGTNRENSSARYKSNYKQAYWSRIKRKTCIASQREALLS